MGPEDFVGPKGQLFGEGPAFLKIPLPHHPPRPIHPLAGRPQREAQATTGPGKQPPRGSHPSREPVAPGGTNLYLLPGPLKKPRGATANPGKGRKKGPKRGEKRGNLISPGVIHPPPVRSILMTTFSKKKFFLLIFLFGFFFASRAPSHLPPTPSPPPNPRCAAGGGGTGGSRPERPGGAGFGEKLRGPPAPGGPAPHRHPASETSGRARKGGGSLPRDARLKGPGHPGPRFPLAPFF